MAFNTTAPCPECRKVGMDNTGDNLAIYDDGVYCHCCGYSEGNGESRKKGGGESAYVKPVVKVKAVKSIMTPEEWAKVKANTTSKATYRGIRPETNAYFGIRYKVDENDVVLTQYVPTTINDQISGLTKRDHPKGFGTVYGKTGKECQLSGQFRFKTSNRTVLVVGGQVDQLSAYQMLRDDQVKRGKEEFDPFAVVSPTVGEGGSESQLSGQYKFFDQFDKIILGYDNDEAGKAAMDKVIKVLPKGKVFIANWRYKDPNCYIWDKEKGVQIDRQAAFISDFWGAKKYVPAGIVPSNQLMDKMLASARIPKIPLPPFFSELQKEMAGGIPLGYIVNFAASSGAGKTSIVNELMYFWIYNSPYKIGVISTELEAGQYSEVILSRHLGKKLALFEDVDSKMEYLSRPDVIEKATDLFQTPDGEGRWMLVDDRDGGFASIKNTTEEMVSSCGCKIIMIDVLSDFLTGMSNEQQGEVMKWQKGMIKSHGITFINVNHTRKKGTSDVQGSQGGFITEEDQIGSSEIYKSAGANILFMRDKYAEDAIERNTTKVSMPKCRWSGNTGWAGELYYDNPTHTLYDKKKWMAANGVGEF